MPLDDHVAKRSGAALGSPKRWRLLFVTSVSLFYFYFLNTFYNCIVLIGFLPWEKRVAFPGESSDMDHGIFNVRTDVNACNCTRVCADTVRESALKVDSGIKIPCRTGESNLRRQRASLMLYQLSYIPFLLSNRQQPLLLVL